MKLNELTLQTIQKELANSRVGVAFAEALKACALDCEDRATDSAVRKVTLTIELTPEADEHGLIEQVWTQFFVEHKVPKRKTKPINMQYRKGGMLVFSEAGEEEEED